MGGGDAEAVSERVGDYAWRMTTAASSGTGMGVSTFGARVGLALRDIKLAHSVFALPFAVLGVFLAGGEGTRHAAQGTRGGGGGDLAIVLGLVVACMVCARTWAMLVNRIADREFDAKNPRTARRAVASGALRARDAMVFAAASGAAFIVLTAGFGVVFGNWWPLWLSVPTLLWIGFYSFTKRFTPLAHMFLGGALAASPLAAAIAVDPAALREVPALWFLAGMVLFWVAGFDVLYALQDEGFDREEGLRSIPAWLGTRRSQWVSRGMHVVAALLLIAAWRVEPRLGVVFGAAVGLICGVLVAEHWWLSKKGIVGLPMSFGVLNGVVSLAAGGFGVVDVLA